jgi:hypothetical protein
VVRYQTKVFKVVIKPGTKRITLFRFLLADLLYSKEEGFSIEKYLVLFELYFGLLDNPDPLFREKWQKHLMELKPLMDKLSRIVTFPVRIPSKALEQILDFLKDNLLLPNKSAFFGLKGNRDLLLSFGVVFDAPWKHPSPRPKPFIGVGYKDKGHCRTPAEDGSPSWQEVARSHIPEREHDP